VTSDELTALNAKWSLRLALARELNQRSLEVTCRKCSEAISRGEVLAVAHDELSLLTAVAEARRVQRWWRSEHGHVAHLLVEGVPGSGDHRSPWTACSTGFVGTVEPAELDAPRCEKCAKRDGRDAQG
jgi:hypothetical protein